MFTGTSLVREVVDRQTDPLLVHPDVLVDLEEEYRHERGLPVVAMDDLGTTVCAQHELQSRLREKGKPRGVVVEPVQLTAIEEFILGVRVDEKAPPAVNEAEPHRAVDESAVPGDP